MTLVSYAGLQLSTLYRNLTSGFTYKLVLKESSSKKLEEIATLVDAGKLRPVVDSVYPWDQVHAAFAKLLSGRAVGKVVVTVDLD